MRGCWLSVLITALATGAAFAFWVLITDDRPEAAMAFMFGVCASLVVVGLSAAVIGVPLTRLFENSGWERPWSYPLAGFVIGGAIAYLILEALSPRSLSVYELRELLFGALPGTLCGGLWWWFERRHKVESRIGK